MKEVISLHVGQFGVQVGNALWELYCFEHEIEPNGELKNENTQDEHNLGAFFTEHANGSYTSRAIFTDLESGVVDEIRNGPYKELHDSSRLISGDEDAANNYARGRYNIGRKQIGSTAEVIRVASEHCDQVNGFMTFHSLTGGTGSGFHSLIDDLLSDNYNKKRLLEVALIPSSQLSTSVVEPYNTVLATNAAMDKTNCVMLIDNEAIYNICSKKLHLDIPGYNNINRIISQAISTTTCSLRFESSLQADLIDFPTNLVPFPRLHFPVFGLSPIHTADSNSTVENTVEMTSQCFDQQYRLATCNDDKGLYMACCLMFRGDNTPKEMHEAVASIKKKMKFVDWSPTGFKISSTSRPAISVPGSGIGGSTRTVCMLSNNTAMQDVWKSIYNKYNLMSRKGAFYHWYLEEGMEQSEFTLAGDNLATLIDTYNEVTISSQ
ncbi:hypothetical protein O3M35_002921 [Rhynocoris fuscipes]|uniref:Tubulin alpha chain n=1 Tax=Rhynocoris fuscipes TaxID=488301 RepID=A0AAW1CR93_9HEMI